MMHVNYIHGFIYLLLDGWILTGTDRLVVVNYFAIRFVCQLLVRF